MICTAIRIEWRKHMHKNQWAPSWSFKPNHEATIVTQPTKKKRFMGPLETWDICITYLYLSSTHQINVNMVMNIFKMSLRIKLNAYRNCGCLSFLKTHTLAEPREIFPWPGVAAVSYLSWALRQNAIIAARIEKCINHALIRHQQSHCSYQKTIKNKL